MLLCTLAFLQLPSRTPEQAFSFTLRLLTP